MKTKHIIIGCTDNPTRKLRRNRVRTAVGNSNLSEAWKKHQEKRYGKHYKEICKPRRHTND